MRNSAAWQPKRSRKLVRLALGAFALTPLLMPMQAWPADPASKAIDLDIPGGVASIATRSDGRGFVAAFSNCQVAYLDNEAALQSQQVVNGCKHMFTVHVGRLGDAEAATVSTYTGHGVVLSGGKITKYKTHNAAVTEAFLASGGLLTSSDDGSVNFTALEGQNGPPPILATGQGVARIMLPDPRGTVGHPAFFIAFDSGHVQAVNAAGTRMLEPGVGRINGIALSADGTSLYVVGFIGRMARVDVASGTVKDMVSGGADLNAVALDDVSSRVATVNDDGRLIVLDAKSGRTIIDMKVSDAAATAVALAAGGRRALVGDAAGTLYRIELPD